MIKECIYCKKIFKAQRKTTKYCSKKCKHNIGKIKIKCKYCKNIFETILSKNRIYCSRMCQNKDFNDNHLGENHPTWKGGKSKCIDCNKECSSNNLQRCRECYKKYNSGMNHWNWQGGITNINHKIRNCEEYKKWRNLVYTRDNYRCQLCSKKGVYLEAHHIKRFIDFENLRFDVDNGITLCKECHNKTKFHEKDYENLFQYKVQQNYAGMLL